MSEQVESQPSGEESQAELAGGAYDIIRARLGGLAKTLGEQAERLNQKRTGIFGATEMSVLGNERIRTENNCVPRDIMQVRGHLLFGYNVFLGLKREISVDDIFSVQRFKEKDDGYEFTQVPTQEVSWLADPRFQKDLQDLYSYNKGARLSQLMQTDTGRMLAVFQTGDAITDVRVLRWAIDQQEVTYLDNRGEADYLFPPRYDFEWTSVTRDDFVRGNHPHVNILDTVFVETVGGDLTIKVEDNTEDGEGIYSEPVEDKHQGLEDAPIRFAKLGALILIEVHPYREEQKRYFAFHTRSQSVTRLDRIGQSCQQLPEDHGVIFPGGYVLEDGEVKNFDIDSEDLIFMKMQRSPNGEDVMYIFYRKHDGASILLPYNLIRKEVQNPIVCHGYTIFDDGKMVVFRAEEAPTRVHHTRIWQSAFMTEDEQNKLSAASEHAGSFLMKVGNSELVRGIADAKTVQRAIANQKPSVQVYEDLISSCVRIKDSYHWLQNEEAQNLHKIFADIERTSELIIDEFEKVLAIQKAAALAIKEASDTQSSLFIDIRPDTWESVDAFIEAMAKLRSQRGRLITLKEMRYIDLKRVESMEQKVQETFEELSEKAVVFLLSDTALKPYHDKLAEFSTRSEAFTVTSEVPELADEVQAISAQLDLLTEVLGGLSIEDPNARTQILEEVSEIFGQVNRTRATIEARQKELGKREAVLEFGAQFKLLSQSVQSALGLCDTPEKCDEQLTRLMVQLEELEGRFGEFDEFLGDLTEKRTEIYESFSTRKQTLTDGIARRAQNLSKAATRILEGVARRGLSMKTMDDLNAYFAADTMIMKVRDICSQLDELGDGVKADTLRTQLKSSKDTATRQLRDKTELFEGDSQLVKFGKHRFSVNNQALELTLLPSDGEMRAHLTGTDFSTAVADERLAGTEGFWNQSIVSENEEVSRIEYLSFQIVEEAEKAGALNALIEKSLDDDAMIKHVREFCANRYDEGYERGVHDTDAVALLKALLPMRKSAGLFRFAPEARAKAQIDWAHLSHVEQKEITTSARNLGRLRKNLNDPAPLNQYALELSKQMRERLADVGIEMQDAIASATYLIEQRIESDVFVVSQSAVKAKSNFEAALDKAGDRRSFDDDMRAFEGDLKTRYKLTSSWARAFAPNEADELTALLMTSLNHQSSAILTSIHIDGILSQHKRIQERQLQLRYDEYLKRLSHFSRDVVPAFKKYRQTRNEVALATREQLRVDEFMPRVLSSFVRNKLINDVYLPIIGDNLAKQLGAAGNNKRTDLMGLLLLISPPGYGKTTLMEYVASRLGLVFMKVNGPSLGHEVHSLDPADAPNATAKQEVEKINLAFEMGNNVMLYLDDIQHTHPELLQKFISLCDGSRRVEGVWQGKTRTYDLRGKKFCVVMAGNPYTESGEKFQIPDMLSNRADTYNLGDILSGKDDAFALSYIENSLTSNTVLQPLATREQSDVYHLIRMAQGETPNSAELKHAYSSAETEEIVGIFKKMIVCQKVLLDVNAEYIRSASMDDRYRTEPPFKLQGSYRNMNKLAEKIVSVMNEEELDALIDDHYRGEAQTLTTGAEQNLLKLKELRGRLSDEEAARWLDIKKTYQRTKGAGGDEADPVMKITSTIAGMSQRVSELGDVLKDAAKGAGQQKALSVLASTLGEQQKQTHAALNAIGDALKHQKDAAQNESLDAIARALTQNKVVPALEKLEASLTNKEADKSLAQGLEKLGEGFRDVRIDVNVPGPSGLHELLDMQRLLLEKLAAHQKVSTAAAPVAASVSLDDAPATSEILKGIDRLQNTIEEAEERRRSYRPFKAVGVIRDDDD